MKNLIEERMSHLPDFISSQKGYVYDRTNTPVP